MFGKRIEKILAASIIFLICSVTLVGMVSAEPGARVMTHTVEMREGSPCLVLHGEVLSPTVYWVSIRTSGPERVVTTGEGDETGEFLVVYPGIEEDESYIFGIGTETNRFIFGQEEVVITAEDIESAYSESSDDIFESALDSDRFAHGPEEVVVIAEGPETTE